MNIKPMAKLRYSPYSRLLTMFLAGAWAAISSAEQPKARVVSVIHAGATRDAANPRAFFRPQDNVVHSMVATGIRRWTGQQDLKTAWRSLVSPGETIGIKVTSAPGSVIGTRLAVVRAVVRQLLAAGIRGRDIILWDRRLDNLHTSGFVRLARELGVSAEGAMEAGFDRLIKHEAALHVPLTRGDLDFGKKRYSRFSHTTRLISRRLDKIIQISPLLHQPAVGVQGNLYGLSMEACDNVLRFKLGRRFQKSAVPDMFNMTTRRGLILENGFQEVMDKVIQQGGEGIQKLLPPNIDTTYAFFYRPESPLKPIPPLQAWRFALRDALEEGNQIEATVEILHPNGEDASSQTFHPDGQVEYYSTVSKAVIHVTDALLCQYLAGEVRLQYSSVMNELRFSNDAVALDALSMDDLERLTRGARVRVPPVNRELLQNAAGMGLGVDARERIQVERVKLSAAARNRE